MSKRPLLIKKGNVEWPARLVAELIGPAGLGDGQES